MHRSAYPNSTFHKSKPFRHSELFRHWRLNALAAVLVGLFFLSGCTTDPPEFRFNQVEYLIQERKLLEEGEQLPAHLKSDISNLVTAMFGTPNEPFYPFLEGEEDPAQSLIDYENLRIAAGPVKSDQEGTHFGLYREHCAQCHGITGDGRGPTSGFLQPYPRDFRMGRFKFKSTSGLTPPTDDDLRRVIREGIPGTAMPSFKLLDPDEIDALIDYVKYLSIRGEFERQLINQVGQYVDESETTRMLNWSDSEESYPLDEQVNFLVEDYYYFGSILDKWLGAEDKVTEVPARPASFPDGRELIRHGRDLFYGRANCAQCHGMTGLGDGQTKNYNLWTTNWLETPGVEPADPETYREFINAGAFPPRTVQPRNLRLRVFRGGGRPEDIYRRIANGIDGTPMPAASALSSEEIWSLVAYVMQMPDESLTEMKGGQP